MAGEATIGALRVILGADTAKFEEGMKRAQTGLAQFGKRAAEVGAGIQLQRAVEATFRAIAGSISDAFEQIDKLGKTAQKVGIPVEELSKLNFAATLADVSLDQLATGMGKLAKNMADTAAGTGEAKATFEALGIEVRNTDGSMKSVSDVLVEVSDKFATTSDGVNKTAAAMAIFGKAGKDLIPLLNDGSASLKEMGEIAERMGLVISKETAAGVQKFNDNLKILKLAGDGFVNTVIAGIIPGLVGLSNEFVRTAQSGDYMRQSAGRIIAQFKEMIVFTNQVVSSQVILGTAFKELQRAVTSFPTDIEASSEAYRNLLEIIDKLPTIMRQAREETERWFGTAITVGKGLGDLAGKTDKFTEEMQRLELQTRVNVGTFAALAPGFAEMAVKLDLTDKTAAKLGT